MLVLSRKVNQEIRIGNDVRIQILGIKGNQVRVGITASPKIQILREEVLAKGGPPRRERSPKLVAECAHC